MTALAVALLAWLALSPVVGLLLGRAIAFANPEPSPLTIPADPQTGG